MLYLSLVFLVFALWLFMLLVAATNCLKSRNAYKARWLFLIVLLPFFGPILYFSQARGQFVAEL